MPSSPNTRAIRARRFNAVALAATACAMAPGASAKTGDPVASFCERGQTCSAVNFSNGASVTVKAINLTQEKTGGACSKVSRKITRNLAGDVSFVNQGQSAAVELNQACQYKVKFVTTSGCTGDKVTHVKVKDFPEIARVNLKGGCGTLSVKKIF